MASINDRFTETTNGSRPQVTTLNAQKIIGAPSLSTNGLSGWPTNTAVHFILYRIDNTVTPAVKVPGSQTDWKGIVSGTTITNLTLKAGTDTLYESDGRSVVEAAPTAAWADDVVEGIAVAHNQDGTHKPFSESNIVPTNAIQANAVTTAKLADASVTAIKLLVGSDIQTYTNTGDGGGTGYYLNLGGLKLCWGTSGTTSIPGAVTRNISLPSSFFTNVRYSSVTPGGGTAVVYMQLGGAVTTSNIPVYVTPTTNGNIAIQWLVIGS